MKPSNFKTKLRSYIIIFSAVLLASCGKEKHELSIVIKNADCVEITGDTIPVSLNSVHQTLIDVVFFGNSPKYLRQTDQKEIEKLNSKDYYFISSGQNSDGNFEKVVITTNFSDSLMHVGSIVKISVRISTDMAKSTYYKVIQ